MVKGFGELTRQDYDDEVQQRGKDIDDFHKEVNKKYDERNGKTREGFDEYHRGLNEYSHRVHGRREHHGRCEK